MKLNFSFSDDNVMLLNCVASVSYGIHAMAQPADFNRTFLTSAGNPCSTQWFGYATAGQGALGWTVARSASTTAKKEMLKTSGLLWAGAAGLHLFNAHRGTEPKQPAYGSAAIAGVLAVLSLTKGFN